MDKIHVIWNRRNQVLSILTIGILTIGVLALGIIAFIPQEDVSAFDKGKGKHGWHQSDSDGHYPTSGESDPCPTKDGGNGVLWHKNKNNGGAIIDKYICKKDHSATTTTETTEVQTTEVQTTEVQTTEVQTTEVQTTETI